MTIQPLTVDLRIAGGVFVKSTHIHHAGTVLQQHKHTYDHVSAITMGTARVWKDGAHVGDHEAPALLTIEAGVTHVFEALTDSVVILCIHAVADGAAISLED
jgi:mannose-6-phosphate isomerase-like protein (cupin superfamily)